MLGDQDYPIQSEDRVMTADERRAMMMDDLRQAMEVLPAVVTAIGEYTDESLEMFAHRIILATSVLHAIERRLNEGYERAQRGEDDDCREDEIWEGEDGPSEEDKDRAIAAVAAQVNGTDIYDEEDDETWRRFGDGVD